MSYVPYKKSVQDLLVTFHGQYCVCCIYIYIYIYNVSFSLRYKERLQWKYLSQQHRHLNALTSVKWRFIPNGSDDFRSGVPPPSDDSFLKKV